MLNYQGEEGQWCILDASLKENELLLDKCSQYHMHVCESMYTYTQTLAKVSGSCFCLVLTENSHFQKFQDDVSL